MNINKTASVKMRWDTFTFPVKAGTPVSRYGVLANDANAYGLVIQTVARQPDADEYLHVMTDGVVEMEEVIAGFGTELTSDAMTAMSGIHVFSNGVRQNPAEESVAITAETNTRSSDVTAILANIAATYSKKTYSAGDYCIYSMKLYRCKSNISTAENWTASHWQQTTIMAELVSLTADEVE